jgi:hypothetical protein
MPKMFCYWCSREGKEPFFCKLKYEIYNKGSETEKNNVPCLHHPVGGIVDCFCMEHRSDKDNICHLIRESELKFPKVKGKRIGKWHPQ